MQIKKKFTIVLCIVVVILLIVCISKLLDKQITGEEWFYQQEEYIDAMGTVAASLDNIVSLYINGNISETDYTNHVLIIQEEMTIISMTYNQHEKEYPVKVGTHSYDTKAGCEATKDCIKNMSSLIENCLNPEIYQDKDRLSYVYLAYNQPILDFLSIYVDSVGNIAKSENKGE